MASAWWRRCKRLASAPASIFGRGRYMASLPPATTRPTPAKLLGAPPRGCAGNSRSASPDGHRPASVARAPQHRAEGGADRGGGLLADNSHPGGRDWLLEVHPPP